MIYHIYHILLSKSNKRAFLKKLGLLHKNIITLVTFIKIWCMYTYEKMGGKEENDGKNRRGERQSGSAPQSLQASSL